MPVARTLLPQTLSHWQYASDSEFCSHLCHSFEDFFASDVCGFCFLSWVVFCFFISKSNCFWNTHKDLFLSFVFHSIVISCAIAKLATVRHQTRTAQVNVIDTEKIYIPLFSFFIFIHSCLYAHNAIVSTSSVYASLVHAKACEYENDKDNENKCFSVHPPLWNVICLPLEIA